jgi:hypothetical protein
MKFLITILLLFKTFLFGQDSKTFNIEMLNERNYPTHPLLNESLGEQKKSISGVTA